MAAIIGNYIGGPKGGGQFRTTDKKRPERVFVTPAPGAEKKAIYEFVELRGNQADYRFAGYGVKP